MNETGMLIGDRVAGAIPDRAANWFRSWLMMKVDVTLSVFSTHGVGGICLLCC